jgi:hypothetical protein
MKCGPYSTISKNRVSRTRRGYLPRDLAISRTHPFSEKFVPVVAPLAAEIAARVAGRKRGEIRALVDAAVRAVLFALSGTAPPPERGRAPTCATWPSV